MRHGRRCVGTHGWVWLFWAAVATSSVMADGLVYRPMKDSDSVRFRCVLTGDGEIDLYGVQEVKLQADLSLQVHSEAADPQPLLKTVLRLDPGFLDVTVDGEPNAIAVEKAHVVVTHEPTGKVVKTEGVASLDFLHADVGVDFSSLLATLFLPRLPERDLSEGDEWSDETTLETSSGQQLVMKRTYRLVTLQKDDGLALMNVEIEVPLDNLKIEPENLVMGGQQKASLRQTWDIRNGRLIASQGTVQLKARAFADEARRAPVAGIDVQFRIDAQRVSEEEQKPDTPVTQG